MATVKSPCTSRFGCWNAVQKFKPSPFNSQLLIRSIPNASAVFGQMQRNAFSVIDINSLSEIKYGNDVTNQSAIAAVTADLDCAKNVQIINENVVNDNE